MKVYYTLQIVNAVERDSGDYECQLTGDDTEHHDEDLVLNQKLEINVFDKEKSSNDERSLDSRGREKTSKAESVLASFVQNDQMRVAKEEKRPRLSRQERKSDERTNFQSSSSGSPRLGVSTVSLGLCLAAILCSVL